MEPPRDSAPENATLAVAQLFLNFSATDRLFVNETASNFAKYCWHKTPQASDFALARRLPDLELSQTAVVLRQAISECELVAAGGYRPPTRQAPSHTSLDNGIGYLTDGEGVPFFPMGYSQYPGFDGSVHDATLSSLGVSLGEAYFTPGMILSATGCCNISEARLQSIVAQARTASTRATTLQVSIGNGQAPHSYVFPAWAEEMYPNLTSGAGRVQFYSYDIDNPGAKHLFGIVLDALVPAVANLSILGWDLANEPGFYAANSSYTFANFQGFLRQRYNGSTASLSASWGIPVSSFSDHRLLRGMGWQTFSQRQLLDWHTFNARRVTAWYSWLCQAIRSRYQEAGAGDTSCFIKASNSASGLWEWTAGPDGIDRGQLSKVLSISGCDTRLLPTSAPHWTTTMVPLEAYAIDWLATAASYDLMRSLTGGRQPVLELEWHSISTTGFRQEVIPAAHMRASWFIATVHGLAASEIWYWGRQGWSGRQKGADDSGFAASMLAQPQMLDAFTRVGMTMNSIAKEMTGIALMPHQVRLLYSVRAREIDWSYCNSLVATYSLLHSLGVPVAFVTGEQLAGEQGTDDASPLIIAGDSYVSAAVQSAVRHAAAAGVPVLTAGNVTNTFLHNDHGEATSDGHAWAMGLPSVPFSTADTAAFASMSKAINPMLRRDIGCVDAAVDAPRHPGVFGVVCRYSDKHLLVLNLLNTTSSVGIVRANGSSPHVSNVLNGAPVALPVLLQPLEEYLLRIE